MHLESTKLWVDEFVRAVLPHGTTAVAADPHEIANVFGIPGIVALAEASARLPFTFGISAPSCVPASHFESPAAEFSSAELTELARKARGDRDCRTHELSRCRERRPGGPRQDRDRRP